MNSQKVKPASRRSFRAVLRTVPTIALVFVLAAFAQVALAQTETTLYTFCSLPNCADGTTPSTNLLLNANGALYGTAGGGGGDFAGGVVFELSLEGGETLLYNFTNLQEGLGPNGGLVQDSSGNFYGTTAGGGNDQHPCKKYAGCGLVYELSNGTETVLYDFLGTTDGFEPNGSLVRDKDGNLYGTTYNGGSVGGIAMNGTVFKISPTGSETVLHRFAEDKADGKFPNAGLVMDKHGNFYGTTIEGGVNGDYGPGIACDRECGVVYEMTASGTEKVLYAFRGSKNGDGAAPFDSLILDSKGNLYGTTYAGGSYGQGTVFELSPSGQETVLYSFSGTPDGGYPVGHLVMDSQGNIYGTTSFGGAHNQGTVFELTHAGAEKSLYSFTGGADGGSPLAGMVMDSQGNLYGTTFLGGNFNSTCQVGCGVVFKVTP